MTAPAAAAPAPADEAVVAAGQEEDVLEQDLLVEDVSIDGMCGVY